MKTKDEALNWVQAELTMGHRLGVDGRCRGWVDNGNDLPRFRVERGCDCGAYVRNEKLALALSLLRGTGANLEVVDLTKTGTDKVLSIGSVSRMAEAETLVL